MSSVQVTKHQKKPHSRHEFTVEVSAVKMVEFFERAYEKLAATVEIKGFRRGQAPKLMTIQRIGSERYFQTALDLALPTTYVEAAKSLNLRPVSPPEINIVGYGEGAPFTYVVVVDVIPEVDPGKYKAIRVKPPKSNISVAQKEIDEVLERLRKQQAKVEPVGRPAQKGDRVEIDYVGTVDNVKRDDLSSQHFPLMLGEGVLSKTFESQLIGKKKGETVEFEDKVNDQKVHFAVVVHEVTEVTLPELTPKFAEQFGRKNDIDLKEAIESQLKAEKEAAARHELENVVLEAVMKEARLDIPRSLVEEEISRRIDQIKQQLGTMFPKFLEREKKTETELRKELVPQAERIVKTGLIMGEIAKREGFGTDRKSGEDDIALQRRVVHETLNFLIASATEIKATDN
ncbi:trigger factor [Candidatus Berkelbacteria bacterium]|nr:trigger factor [Candidatus Berkelbacteria bacterium]